MHSILSQSNMGKDSSDSCISAGSAAMRIDTVLYGAPGMRQMLAITHSSLLGGALGSLVSRQARGVLDRAGLVGGQRAQLRDTRP